jgi:hypothetical protein
MINYEIHGRESFTLHIRCIDDATGEESDISTLALYLEDKKANLRKALIADDANPLGRVIFLTMDEVDALPTFPTAFIVRDETDADAPLVIWEATLQRVGWTGEVQS